MRISDEELMMRCRSGDAAAFELIVMRFKDHIINYICRSVGDYHQAEDLAQETFIRLISTNYQTFLGTVQTLLLRELIQRVV